MDVASGTEGHQMCIIGGRHIRHRSIAAREQVAQRIGKFLQQIGREVRIVANHLVLGRFGYTLDGSVGHLRVAKK
jgi:H2-forming N5,N10-methylenetetrahydromethanopterin dehydrogenase-like enzyme